MFRSFVVLPGLVAGSLLVTSAAYADTLEVGPDKTLKKPCAAFAAAKDGDTIQIDGAGDYTGDVCAVLKNKLTIRGVNGRPKIDANGTSSGGKAAWIVSGDDTTIDNIEFLNAKANDKNGAGIRQEGTNVTIRNCSFHDNEDGILAGDNADSTVTIENSEFFKNGFGDGQSHNLYINHVGSLVFRFNYSHDAKIGHLLKSRAKTSLIAYNRLTDENGTASYEIDLPNAGTSYVIGNIIEQSATTDNPALIAYGEEGITTGWGSDLYVVNNTLVNHRAAGATSLMVAAEETTKVQLTNDIFFGPGTVTNQAGAVQTTNYADADPKFVDPAKFDFHLADGSPAIDKGTTPANAGAMSLVPDHHYVHPTSSIGRKTVGAAIDIGAYEKGGDVVGGADGGASSSSSSSSGSATGPGTSSSGGGSSSGNANGAAPTPASDDDDGCGCHTTPSRSSAALGVGAFFALSVLLRRRRR
jgi:hypothetical protein